MPHAKIFAKIYEFPSRAEIPLKMRAVEGQTFLRMPPAPTLVHQLLAAGIRKIVASKAIWWHAYYIMRATNKVSRAWLCNNIEILGAAMMIFEASSCAVVNTGIIRSSALSMEIGTAVDCEWPGRRISSWSTVHDQISVVESFSFSPVAIHFVQQPSFISD